MVINIITIIVLLITAYIIYITNKKTNELELMPFPVLYFHENIENGEADIICKIKNCGNGSALNIGIDSYFANIPNPLKPSILEHYELIFQVPKTNIINVNEEIELILKVFIIDKKTKGKNDVKSKDMKNIMISLLQNEAIELNIHFQNIIHNKYYTKVKCDKETTKIMFTKKKRCNLFQHINSYK
ncbi:MAG: hypothetical protein ACYDAS_00115 [Patescibacteria group bacterium]